MRLVLVMVLAGLVASPLSTAAQGTDKGWVEEFYPELAPREATQPVSGEPALELTSEHMDHRVRKAKVGLGVSAGVSGVGLTMVFVAVAGSLCLGEIASGDDPSCPGPWVVPVGVTGGGLFVGGIVGMIVSGVALHNRKRDRDRLRQTQYGRRDQIHWDLARSRLVF